MHHAVVLIGLAIGALCDRSLRCELQVVQRLRLVAASAKVISELRRNLGRATPPGGFLPLGDTAMQLDAPAGSADAMVKNLLIERVMEAEIRPLRCPSGP